MHTVLQVVKAAGVTKDALWIAELHEQLAAELTKDTDAELAGMLMDNTKANRAAMHLLRCKHPEWVFIGCQGHALSLLLKDFAGKSTWAKPLFEAAGTIVNSINGSERVRALVNQQQERVYGKVSIRRMLI
jgi:hypothetical protein